MFSATFPQSIQQLAKAFLRVYTWVGVGRVGSTVNKQFAALRARHQRQASQACVLVAALVGALPQLTLVFVQKKRTQIGRRATDERVRRRFRAESIHG